MDFKKAQKRIYDNKISKGFNTTDVNFEFNCLYGEVAEAFNAYFKKKDDLGEELADVAIYLLSICNMTGVDLEKEIERKLDKNEKRVYKDINGVKVKVKD